MKRVVFGTGLAVGYVLGARAGRERYEAIARTVRSLADRPDVQSTAGILSAHAHDWARSALHRAPHEATAHVSPN